jgi:hypothetical protein
VAVAHASARVANGCFVGVIATVLAVTMTCTKNPVAKTLVPGEDAQHAIRISDLRRRIASAQDWSPIEFNGRRRTQWTSPDDAMMAVVHHRTGLAGWDRTRLVVSDDLLRWRQLGENF